MRVLVTGATGFVGGHIARRLHAGGHEVTATGRNPEKGLGLGVPFKPGHLDDPRTALELCRNTDAVVHCAAYSSPWGSPEQFRLHNEQVTSNLLSAEVSRFIHISSAGVYFQQNEGLDAKESDPLPARNGHPYLDSKRRAELLVKESAGWVILRPRAVYGPGDTALLPRILRLMKPGLLPVFGTGHNLASLTHVENLALAAELSLSGPSGQVYNVSDGEPVKLWPLLSAVAQHLSLPPIRWRLHERPAKWLANFLEWFYSRWLPQREPPLTRYTLSLLCKSQTLNLDKARRELGYQPLFSTENGVLKTLEALC